MKAMSSPPLPAMHWDFYRFIKRVKSYNPPDSSLVPWAPRSVGWDYIGKGDGKRLSLVFPINYHITVPKDVHLDGRKIVQRVWNHRVYSDKETWECSYYDLSGLTKDESSWKKAKWQTGWIVKMETAFAVEKTLPRAILIADKRVIRGAVKSIISSKQKEEIA